MHQCHASLDCSIDLIPIRFNCWQQALIDPAIQGTKNVLKSCSKASSVRRVVLTSSCSSIRYRYDVTLVSPLNESHWSDPEYCKRYKVSLLIFLTCFQQCAFHDTRRACSSIWEEHFRTTLCSWLICTWHLVPSRLSGPQKRALPCKRFLAETNMCLQGTQMPNAS